MLLVYTQLNIRTEYYLNRDPTRKIIKQTSTVQSSISSETRTARGLLSTRVLKNKQHNTIQYNTKKQPVRRKKKKKKRDDHNTIRFKRNVALVSQSVKQSVSSSSNEEKVLVHSFIHSFLVNQSINHVIIFIFLE